MFKAKISGINRHSFACVDSGTAKLLNFDRDGILTSELPTGGGSFDLSVLPNNDYLYCFLGSPEGHGVKIVDKSGNEKLKYLTPNEIFSCSMMDNGNVLVGELTEQRLVEVNPRGEIEKIIKIKCTVGGHETMRMVRQGSKGTYLVTQPGDKAIRRYGANGDVLQEIQTLGDTFSVIEKTDGSILYTAQKTIVEVDKNGAEAWKVTADEAPEISFRWLTGMQLLSNGNLIVCNWLGHGFEGQGVPVFEINGSKQILWKFEAPDFTSNIANIYVLD